ncbi:hypothetical protein LPJ66_010026 [Kickxella alabastrina]|uniref:Uncharacterized protein n=1 Tax=Kickxella alabastrina TaxID=61397 RepID=A0ACC1I299_9FUNG|nr:hypothetical protein LPJ66_010026 [Kickxella alabastrina]
MQFFASPLVSATVALLLVSMSPSINVANAAIITQTKLVEDMPTRATVVMSIAETNLSQFAPQMISEDIMSIMGESRVEINDMDEPESAAMLTAVSVDLFTDDKLAL